MTAAMPAPGRPDGWRVAAVIVTYQRPEELRLVVDALEAQTRRPDHLIVFDNGGTIRADRSLKGSELPMEIILSPSNVGGAGGFSRGLERALAWQADWIWLLDDDAIPRPDALANLIGALPGLPDRTGGVGVAVREYGRWAVRHRRRFCSWAGWEWPLARARYRQVRAEIDTASFVGFLVAAEAARAVALPDADLFMAFDDTDYSLRLRRAGWRLWLIPGAVVDHLRSPESRLHSSRLGSKHYYNIRNRLLVRRRYARCAALVAIDGVLYGLLMWLVTGGWRSLASTRLLVRALRDGLSGRAGRLA